MAQQYYKIAFHPQQYKVEFHTGTDREAVANMQSLNHGLNCEAVIDNAAGERAAEVMADWHEQVKLFDMKPA